MHWDSLAELTSPLLVIPHGERLTGTVTCTNDAGLVNNVHTNTAVILLEPPQHSNSQITFLDHDGSSVNGLAVTKTGDYLQFYWEDFDCPAGDVMYQYRIDYLNGSKSSWTDTGLHNYVTAKKAYVRDDSDCRVEVRGLNERGLLSETINSTILVFGKTPLLTGNLRYKKRA